MQMILLLLICSMTESSHSPVTDPFVPWCEESDLQIDISNTKDTDFRRKTHTNDVTVSKGQTTECVQSYKYLDTIVDDKLGFEANCEAVCTKGHQLLHW